MIAYADDTQTGQRMPYGKPSYMQFKQDHVH